MFGLRGPSQVITSGARRPCQGPLRPVCGGNNGAARGAMTRRESNRLVCQPHLFMPGAFAPQTRHATGAGVASQQHPPGFASAPDRQACRSVRTCQPVDW